MAAIAVWGLLPPVVALLSGRRSAWSASVAASLGMILGVAFSRGYLGLHWLSDILGALLFGALYLVAIETLFEWHHQKRPCGSATSARPPMTGRWPEGKSGPRAGIRRAILARASPPGLRQGETRA